MWISSKYGVGGRFNYGERINSHHFTPFPALYIAEDWSTARKERFGITDRTNKGIRAEDFALMKNTGNLDIPINGELSQVLDITDPGSLRDFVGLISSFKLPAEIRKLEIELGLVQIGIVQTPKKLLATLMDPNWRMLPVQFCLPSNSQVFGKILRDAGIEAVRFSSVRGGGCCLAVFPENLIEGSAIWLGCQAPSSVAHTRLDKTNAKLLC